MKRIFTLLFFVSMILVLLPTTIHAESSAIKLFLEGKALSPEVPPQLINNSTFVPLRIISEGIGAKVGWDSATQQVSIEMPGKLILLTIHNKQASVNGESSDLLAAPFIINQTTMLPIRFITESLGLHIAWNGSTQSVFMSVNPIATGIPVGTVTGTDDGTSNHDNSGDSEGGSVSGAGQVDPGQTVPPVTPSIIHDLSIYGSSLMIQADQILLNHESYLSNPDRLVIDLPNSVLDPNLPGIDPTKQFGEIVLQDDTISKIRYSIYTTNPPAVRIVVDLKHKSYYKVLSGTERNQLAIDVNFQRYRIVLDAGHGGKDPGAESIFNTHEKDFTLPVILKVNELLLKEPMIEPVLTRKDDTFVELNDRVKIANDLQADLFLSVHGNKYVPSASGTETYYYRPESLAFAQIMHKYVVDAAKFPDRGVRNADFRVIKYTTMPAILIEVGYLSNTSDATQMINDDFQNKIASAIVEGIKAYLNL